MHLLLAATIVVFLLLRWWGLRRVRAFERGDVASRLLSAIFPRAPMPPLRRAVLEEFVAWSFSCLVVLLLFGVLLAVAMIFGPFRPIHEWIR